VYIYRSYPKIKPGVPLFWITWYVHTIYRNHFILHSGTIWQPNNEDVFDCRLLNWYVILETYIKNFHFMNISQMCYSGILCHIT